MSKLVSFLDGKKSIIGVVCGSVVWIARSQGWIDEKVADFLLGLILAGTGVAYRAAIKKR